MLALEPPTRWFGAWQASIYSTRCSPVGNKCLKEVKEKSKTGQTSQKQKATSWDVAFCLKTVEERAF
jgi:hypothetical protein